MLAVVIILAADAIAALMIGTFLFRGRARHRETADGNSDAAAVAVALTEPAASVSVAAPFALASIPGPAAAALESSEATRGLLDVIPPAPALRSSPQESVPWAHAVASDPPPADAPEPAAIAFAAPPLGGVEESRAVPSRRLLLVAGAGLVLGAVALAHRR